MFSLKWGQSLTRPTIPVQFGSKTGQRETILVKPLQSNSQCSTLKQEVPAAWGVPNSSIQKGLSCTLVFIGRIQGSISCGINIILIQSPVIWSQIPTQTGQHWTKSSVLTLFSFVDWTTKWNLEASPRLNLTLPLKLNLQSLCQIS